MEEPACIPEECTRRQNPLKEIRSNLLQQIAAKRAASKSSLCRGPDGLLESRREAPDSRPTTDQVPSVMTPGMPAELLSRQSKDRFRLTPDSDATEEESSPWGQQGTGEESSPWPVPVHQQMGSTSSTLGPSSMTPGGGRDLEDDVAKEGHLEADAAVAAAPPPLPEGVPGGRGQPLESHHRRRRLVKLTEREPLENPAGPEDVALLLEELKIDKAHAAPRPPPVRPERAPGVAPAAGTASCSPASSAATFQSAADIPLPSESTESDNEDEVQSPFIASNSGSRSIPLPHMPARPPGVPSSRPPPPAVRHARSAAEWCGTSQTLPASTASGSRESTSMASTSKSEIVDLDDDDDEEEGEDGAGGFAARQRRLPPVRREEAAAPAAEDFVLGDGSFRLAGSLAQGLYPHQLDGLRWLWGLHVAQRGGILGDDMGLGKTRQVASFLAGLFGSKLIRRALVVVPTTLLGQWHLELACVGLKRRTSDYTSQTTPVQRDGNLWRTLQVGGVLLATYDMVANHVEDLAAVGDGRRSGGTPGGPDEGSLTWDYLFLDEAHLVKNPSTKRAKALKELPVGHCILMTGTPIQNKLKELWALFDLCCKGLLGDYKQFRDKFEIKITEGSDRSATDYQKVRGKRAAEQMREIYAPFFLRRMKSEVFPAGDLAEGPAPSPGGARPMPRKNDLVVWLPLTTRQRKLYLGFLHSEQVRSVLDQSKSPLAALTVLKKICDHPALLNEKAVDEIVEGMEDSAGGGGGGDREQAAAVARAAAELAANEDGSSSLLAGSAQSSCKLVFALRLLENLVADGHRALVFSQSRKMLDLVEVELKKRRLLYSRLDGTLPSVVRVQRVQEFQASDSIPLFLLTSQVGGLGLTLTGADRVVILDPAWNPSVDNQSVDRTYRIGQTRDVLIYRLITSGTVEEKIYRKQVFKGGLMKTATEQKDQFRYFSQSDLRDLFRVGEGGFDTCHTLAMLREEHLAQQKLTTDVERHVAELEGSGIVGVSHHDLLFSKAAPLLPDIPDGELAAGGPDSGRAFATRRAPWEAPLAPAMWGGAAASMDGYGRRWAEEAASQAHGTVAALREQLARQQKLLHSAVALKDGGDKVRAKIRELEANILRAQASAASLQAHAAAPCPAPPAAAAAAPPPPAPPGWPGEGSPAARPGAGFGRQGGAGDVAHALGGLTLGGGCREGGHGVSAAAPIRL